MDKSPAGERLAQAAFALFDERGYEQTTIDDIADRAGLGRATFFRHYRSKEDVIFPDHERLLQRVQGRLQAPGHESPLAAVGDAARLTLRSYLDEGDIARRRYLLTSRVSALRDREIASVARYQRTFREFIAGQTGPGGMSALRAELMAAAVVAAHNHVLRRWLRGESEDPSGELDDALAQVGALVSDEPDVSARRGESPGGGGDADDEGTTIVAFRTRQSLQALLPALKRLTESSA